MYEDDMEKMGILDRMKIGEIVSAKYKAGKGEFKSVEKINFYITS